MRGRFVVANDERVVRPFLVGFADLRFQRLDLVVGDNADTARAQGLHQRQQQVEVGISSSDGIHQRLWHMEDVALLCEQHDALDAEGETGCRGWFATELFNETVVAATGSNGALGAKGIGRPLKDGVAVVVKAAY